MCGICGTIGFKSSDYVNRMNGKMSHRGPDDVGIWCDESVCLGNTRLAIIDTSKAGHQPMSNENETIWITFNGEIYNFQILGKELKEKGHIFKSNTDTEVILHLYEEYEEKCLDYLRGMFSFAIWDKRKKRLFAVRDRLGIKPFFYFYNGDKFIFASETKALLASDLVEKDLNPEAVKNYFTYGSVQAPETMIKNIFQLMPAHYLIFKNAQLKIQKYWSIDISKAINSRKTEEEYVSEIKTILDEAVKIRMVSDVPLGCFLSGGIDSSVVTALMQKHLLRPIKTLSIVFEEEEYDERQFSTRVAQIFGTAHKQILLNEKDILNEIPAIFEAMDQPSIDGFNTFIISKVAKKEGLTVALSGLGGDELFAGYPSFKTLPKVLKLVKMTKLMPEAIRKSIFGSLYKYMRTKKASKFLFALFRCKNLTELQSLQRMVFLPDELGRLLPDIENLNSKKIFQDEPDNSNFINLISFLELYTYMQNMLLADTDRMSMANSIEVRVPFLDHILVEKMFEIPGRLKVGNDYTKRLLVKSICDLLPAQIYNRPKKGFVFPFEEWLKGKLSTYCAEKFSETNLKKISILNSKEACKIWNAFLKGARRYNYSSILAMLSFINWYERNI